tara:strand:- start:11324 stop:11746 length:423 start_codon:yes stop_codon:yes gene_type:complete
LEFKPKHSQSNLIKEKKDSSASLFVNKKKGHLAHVKICKSENESTGCIVEYPIKYEDGVGRVWIEKEIYDYMVLFGVVSNSTWPSLPSEKDDPLYELDKDNIIEVGMKKHGEKGWISELESNKPLRDLLYQYLLELYLDL